MLPAVAMPDITTPLAAFAKISAALTTPLAELAKISAACKAPLADSVLSYTVRLVTDVLVAVPLVAKKIMSLA